MPLLRRASEDLARKTTRRGFFGRGLDVAFGALAGAAAGTALGAGNAGAGLGTSCAFPGPPCDCMGCLSNGTCAKPCVILTQYYATGCWISGTGATCCDCDCNGFGGHDVRLRHGLPQPHELSWWDRGSIAMPLLRHASEDIARKTTRRGLFGRGLDIAFGALAGAAAGTALGAGNAGAGIGTSCFFPGPPCDCMGCLSNGTCAKPCVILTAYYATGCWISPEGATCCDCDCNGFEGRDWCGCGTDYHNKLQYCPNGNASG